MRAADLFAGAGGFSEGARAAGLGVVFAANHWERAVELHATRHPDAEHVCQDLRQYDFRSMPDVDVLLASPACQGHSNAGQGARGRWGLDHSHHNSDRSTAWAVVDAAEAKRPPFLIVENVPQFLDWELYPVWKEALRRLGYGLSEQTLDAADAGTAQNRERVFVVGTHGKDAPPVRLDECSWTPARSILNVCGGKGWVPIVDKSMKVQERVANGRRNGLGDVFLTQHVTNHPGRSLDRPLPTVTCAPGQLAIVNHDLIRLLSDEELLAAQDFPADYFAGVKVTRKEAAKLAGNAVPVRLAEAVIRKAVA